MRHRETTNRGKQMTSLDLFAEPKARTTDPETSKAAAKKVNSSSDRDELLSAVRKSGESGLTLKEYCEARGYQMSSKSSRCKELETAGLIFYLGDKRDGSRIMRPIESDRGFRVCGKCQGVLVSFYGYQCQRCP
jgi:hypothetical protein